MLKSNLNYLNTILKKKDRNNIIIYFFFSILIALLETIGVGIIPGVLAILLDKNIILERLKFNEQLYNIVFNFIQSENIFVIIAILIFFFFLIKIIINLGYIIFETNLFNKLKINTSSSMFKIYLKKNYLFHSNNNPIILGRNMTSEVNSAISYIKSLLLFLKEIIQVILIGFLLLFANFEISILIFFILTIFGVIYFKIVSKPLKDKVKIAFHERGEKSKIIIQILNSIIEIKLYKKADFFIKKFTNSISREFKSIIFYEIISKLPKQIIELMIIGLISFVIFFTTTIGFKVEAVISVILLYFFAAVRVYPSINNIIIHRLGLIQNKISIQKISNDTKNANIDSETIEQNHEKFQFKKDIRVSEVYFKYMNRNEILKNINFKINKNEIIGLIGKTGSGKSTLVKIIMGLIDPSKGEIHIDNNNIQKIKYEWQNNFAYVSQNFHIIDDTILENIIFGLENDKINNELLTKALKFASLDEFVNNLPEKLDTIVGPNGKKLSGGQAQRLAIARAIYQNRNIIVLDESTNSLDEKTEKYILNKIYSLKGSKTIILITHNKNLLVKCDKVFNIENGKILEAN